MQSRGDGLKHLKLLDAKFPTCYSGQNYQATPHQANGAGLRNRHSAASAASATAADDIIVQRHCTISRQGTAATDTRASIHGDAGERENISRERGARAQGRGAADLPKNILIDQPIGENNS